VMKWLFQVGAAVDITKARADGKTPLRVARTVSIVHWLILQGAGEGLEVLNRDIPNNSIHGDLRSWAQNSLVAAARFRGAFLLGTIHPEPAGAGSRERGVEVGAHVEIHGVESRPELNGCCGRVRRYWEGGQRLGVELDGGRGTFNLSPKNLRRTPEAADLLRRTLLSTVGASAAHAESILRFVPDGADQRALARELLPEGPQRERLRDGWRPPPPPPLTKLRGKRDALALIADFAGVPLTGEALRRLRSAAENLAVLIETERIRLGKRAAHLKAERIEALENDLEHFDFGAHPKGHFPDEVRSRLAELKVLKIERAEAMNGEFPFPVVDQNCEDDYDSEDSEDY
jgi:hypothetical protein